MGTSLSHQEELFLHRQWPELLQDAMTADQEAHAAASSYDAENTHDGDENAEGDGTRPREPAATPNSTTKKTKKGDFHLSFQEWQAFLSVLEQREPSSAPSDVAARLTASQLHVPVAALMVHLCAWWRNAISTAVLRERVEQLVHLVHDIQHGELDGVPKDEREGTADGGGSANESSEQGETDAGPASRRARLARFVMKKVVDKARHRAPPASSSGRVDGAPPQLLLLDAFVDLTCLVQQLLSQETPNAQTIDDSQGDRVGVSPTSAHAWETFDLYEQKMSDKDALQKRPVLAVVMVLAFAISASRMQSQPQLALRALTHVEALQALLFSSSGGKNSLNGDQLAAATTGAATASAPLVALWPVFGEVEVALAHRQHEADVLRCLSSDGDALFSTLRQMREKREMLRSAAAPSASAPALSANERWTGGASQYIGQRHIWTQLRSHFLSAGVFDADKPTVLVFFGPSGYGKSELAKRVASVLHECPMSELESSGKMVYIHMPSFCTKDSIYSLVDPPAAHVGSGILLSALQKHNDAVVVLDEFEKSTAESINNLWLSAFQKNGVLRSLKEASRSVSTVRTTFILTCNIADKSIASREDLYLNASAADQEKIRSLFVTQCKDVCRETLGDPFVNRVDYFFPFMPYTRAERRQFVCLLLERLLSGQAKKGRHLYPTPSFVEAMVDKLHTFHAATLEEAVRSQVMYMVQAGWTSAVLTVERRIGGEVVVLLPTTTTSTKAPNDLSSTSVSRQGADADADASGSGSTRTHSLIEEAWDALPGGAEALQKWTRASSPAAAAAPSPPPSPPPVATKAEEVQVERIAESPAAVIGSAPPPRRQVEQSSDSLLLEREYEHEYATDKKKIVELEKELERTRELVKQRDLEIVTLKEKVLLLQKALAVVVLALASCLCLLAVVIGLKLTLLFALSMLGVVVLVLGVPLTLLLEAARALFRVLGPFKSGVLLLLMALWTAKASRSIMSCS
ncbi:hypothetical protein ABB37_02884 [Leptomonas pyrrhocoris]|uniref:AAA+ ATPase domain-containing protein n=1 Tax=Leptomonas pyrrhocoris TaxID=157538 RepID=A0A0N0VGK0_LEPPY|nr:hypothetical protein ABB37_02884 [Leptomonas pyrrhocoris]KPA83198.1 hypothetical protein ABB37_02884 [Leptomonas pyrrhocoris]|eukprot:XP_015661637.1 hypothetical protein ABB37_02884 [Leptomonas pyrrhocoris]